MLDYISDLSSGGIVNFVSSNSISILGKSERMTALRDFAFATFCALGQSLLVLSKQ